MSSLRGVSGCSPSRIFRRAVLSVARAFGLHWRKSGNSPLASVQEKVLNGMVGTSAYGGHGRRHSNLRADYETHPEIGYVPPRTLNKSQPCFMTLHDVIVERKGVSFGPMWRYMPKHDE